MAWAGQEIENPEIGERLRFVRTAADTEGQLLETEQWLRPGGTGGVVHVHPEQEERFTVIAGALRVRIGREKRELGPGETAVVSPGTPHVFENSSPETTHFRGEVRPALRTEELFERLAALARQGGATPERRLSPLVLAPLVSEYRREVCACPTCRASCSAQRSACSLPSPGGEDMASSLRLRSPATVAPWTGYAEAQLGRRCRR